MDAWKAAEGVDSLELILSVIRSLRVACLNPSNCNTENKSLPFHLRGELERRGGPLLKWVSLLSRNCSQCKADLKGRCWGLNAGSQNLEGKDSTK
jgi:hypothetical protein